MANQYPNSSKQSLSRADVIGIVALCIILIAIVLVTFVDSLPNEPVGLFDYLTKPDDSIAQ